MWRITVDHIESNKVGTGSQGSPSTGWICPESEKGQAETQRYSVSKLIPAARPERFRLFDDDGILYYEGEACNLETGFEPLKWGTWNAGCTIIKYFNEKTDQWEIL